MKLKKQPISILTKKINDKIKSSRNLISINFNKLILPTTEKILLKKALTFKRKNSKKLSLSTDEKNIKNKYNIPNLNLYKNINESILNDLLSKQSMGTFDLNINKKNKEKICAKNQKNYILNSYNKKNINNSYNNISYNKKYKINKNKKVTFFNNENMNNTFNNFNKNSLINSFNKNYFFNNSNSLNNSLLNKKNNPIKLTKNSPNKKINFQKKFSSKILEANLNTSSDFEKMQKLKNINDFFDTNLQEKNNKDIFLRRGSNIDRLILKITNPDENFEDFVQNEKPEDKFIRFKKHLIKNKNFVNKIIHDSILLQRKTDNILLHYNPHLNKKKYFLKSKYGLYNDNEDNNNENNN